jgi:hypothetical protein
MEIAFITGVAVIAADPPESRKLYVDALGLPLEVTIARLLSIEGSIVGISYAPSLHD